MICGDLLERGDDDYIWIRRIMLDQGIFESVSLGKSLLSILFLQMVGL